MTIQKSYFAWIAATSLGLCVGFLAALQILMLINYRQLIWVGGIVSGLDAYLGQLVALLVMGAILGSAQSFVTRSYSVPIMPWILATAAGFATMSAVIIPLIYIGVWGNIPGPIEPLIITVGGCSVAGVFQYKVLKRNQIRAAKWLGIWVVSLILGVIPSSVIFMTLQGPLGISMNWPTEVALTGFLIGGFGALFSGQTFLKTLPQRLAT